MRWGLEWMGSDHSRVLGETSLENAKKLQSSYHMKLNIYVSFINPRWHPLEEFSIFLKAFPPP